MVTEGHFNSGFYTGVAEIIMQPFVHTGNACYKQFLDLPAYFSTSCEDSSISSRICLFIHLPLAHQMHKGSARCFIVLVRYCSPMYLSDRAIFRCCYGSTACYSQLRRRWIYLSLLLKADEDPYPIRRQKEAGLGLALKHQLSIGTSIFFSAFYYLCSF